LGTTNKFIKLFDKFVSLLSFIGAIWIVLIMLIIVADVIGRAFFNQPLTGTAEIVRNSIVGITFLQLAHVLKNDRHIRTTIIMDRLPFKGKMVINTFASFLGAVLFVIIVLKSWDPTWEALRTGEYEGEGALEVPTFPAHFLVLFGSAVMALQFVVIFFTSFRNIFSKNNQNLHDDVSV
jgi:TRAP-type C4-dicarboxylate transport system permease small subunit